MPEGRRRKRKAVTFSGTDKDVQQGDEKKEERYVPRFSTKRARVAPSRSRKTCPVEDETALPVNESEERVAEKQEDSSMIACTEVQQVEGIEDGIPSASQQNMAGCLADKGCDSDTDEARLPHSPQSKANTDGHDNKKQAAIPGLSLSQFVPPPQPSQSEQPLAVENKEEEEEEEEEHTLSCPIENLLLIPTSPGEVPASPSPSVSASHKDCHQGVGSEGMNLELLDLLQPGPAEEGEEKEEEEEEEECHIREGSGQQEEVRDMNIHKVTSVSDSHTSLSIHSGNDTLPSAISGDEPDTLNTISQDKERTSHCSQQNTTEQSVLQCGVVPEEPTASTELNTSPPASQEGLGNEAHSLYHDSPELDTKGVRGKDNDCQCVGEMDDVVVVSREDGSLQLLNISQPQHETEISGHSSADLIAVQEMMDLTAQDLLESQLQEEATVPSCSPAARHRAARKPLRSRAGEDRIMDVTTLESTGHTGHHPPATDGTQILRGLIEELSSLNRFLVGCKKELEVARWQRQSWLKGQRGRQGR